MGPERFVSGWADQAVFGLVGPLTRKHRLIGVSYATEVFGMYMLEALILCSRHVKAECRNRVADDFDTSVLRSISQAN